MNLARDIEAKFRADLAVLLANNKAELDITDDGKGFGLHCGIVKVTVSAQFDEAGNRTSDFCEFRL